MKNSIVGMVALTLMSCGAVQSESADTVIEGESLPSIDKAISFTDARSQPSTVKAMVSSEPNSLPDFALFKDCETCPEMIVIPSGSFVMGSPKDEVGHMHEEEPQIEVTLTRFALARFETSWDEWEVCVSAGKCASDNDDLGWGKGARPISTIDLKDAQAYIGYLNEKETGKYRLPTESEWEYSARAGTKTPFSFGYTISTDQVNFDGNGVYGDGSKGTYREQTVEVGSFPANQFGLFDMHGNVWEWVQDCFVDTLSETPTNGAARLMEDCSKVVVRGGSFDHYPRANRSSIRHYMGPEDQEVDLGFRVARTLN